jgi:threonine synthase
MNERLFPHVLGLRCRACGARAEARAANACEQCFGPLDLEYQPAGALSRAALAARPANLLRWRELLPLAADGDASRVAAMTGGTPLVRADRLAAALGVDELWIKNEAVSHPSLSFKDRLVAVAIGAARALGLDTVACASTGNLGNAVAALAAASGLDAVVLVPHALEPAKLIATRVYGARLVAVRGGYDDASRLASELADRTGWGFVNVNLKPYYAEGSKSVAFEIAEQLGWRLPAHVVVPMAGGSLLHKLHQGLGELVSHGLVAAGPARVHGVQAAGCAPIVRMVVEGLEAPVPVRAPRTLASSLAVGDPGDGLFAAAAIAASGGFAAAAPEEEIAAGMRLLAETTGIFGETAGGVLVAATRALVRQGRIGRGDGPVVLVLTGQGLKTQEAVAGALGDVPVIEPRLAAFEALTLR